MGEHYFEHVAQVGAGRTVFRVHNAGSIPHELVLVRLPEDIAPIADQLRSASNQAVDTVVTMPARAPGSRSTFASDLSPGRYAFICFLREDGVAHYEKGMSSEFRVPGPAQ